MKTLGRGDVYGDPSEQTPYCTHSLQHWNDYSGGDTEYTQYWFLRTVDEMTPDATGDLNNIDVMKAFNAMQGKGVKILVAMDDSKCDFLDREDMHVNSSHDNIDSDVRQDVISLRKKLPHFIDAQKIVGDAMQKCVARGEFNIAKFFHMSKKLRLSNMQMYHTADDIFTQLGIKKIVMNDA